MSSQGQIVDRWVAQVGRPGPRFLRPASSNIKVSRWDERNLVSYGEHFVLARLMVDEDGARSWFLLNGDTYSSSTSQHQATVRASVHRSGLPCMIIPFSVLTAAGIHLDTIEAIEVTEDRFEDTTHTAATVEEVPALHRLYAREQADGTFAWTTRRHWLGASVFRARYRDVTGVHTAYFLSAFDEQESRPHYFLCQLPADAVPVSVKDALELLRPDPVRAADAANIAVTRQGDVFAVPSPLSTREVRRLGPSVKRGRLVGVNHEATEVVVGPDGTTYARGILYHAPEGFGRRPEHRRQKMGDGKTWHTIERNTVPVERQGIIERARLSTPRAWSRSGRVD